MHPVTRLGTFFVFAACLSWTSPQGLGLAGGVLLMVTLICRGAGVSASLRMLWRLRWLLVSILVVFLWFTPGRPVLAQGTSPWMPTWEGVMSGILRIAVLVLLVWAANLLLVVTPRRQLMGALVWWCTPLRFSGMDPERLALRLDLSLEALETLHGKLRQTWQRRAGEGRVALLGRAAADMFRYAAERADAAPAEPREVALVDSLPPWRDWVYPCLLAVLFVALSPL